MTPEEQTPESFEPATTSEEQTVATESVPEEPAAAQRRGSAILTACLIVALPLAYVLMHHAGSSSVQAGTPQVAAANAINVPALEAAVKSNPTESNKINLSLGYINTGQSARAVPLLEAMTVAEPNDSNAWNNLCVANTILQAYQTGVENCTHALAVKPDFTLAKNNLAWATGERDKTIKAITVMEQTAPGKRDAAFYLAEGFDYLHLNNYPEALHAWQRMMEVDPKNAIGANNIGLALMMQKQTDAAIPWFQKAIALDPTMQIAKNNLAWAESVKNAK